MRDMTRFTRVNGSIAAVVVFLVWVYIQAVILLFSLVYVLINLLIDIAYTLFDPRIRY